MGRRRNQGRNRFAGLFFVAGLIACLGWHFRQSWYSVFGAIIAIVLLIPRVISTWKERRLSRAGLAAIDKMSNREFEQRLVTFFQTKGYRVLQVSGEFDLGASLILINSRGSTVVQARRWRARVGVKSIREAMVAKAQLGCDHAMVITNSYFTPDARKFGEANGIELWDRLRLGYELLQLEEQSAPLIVRTSHHRSEAPVPSPHGSPRR